MGGEESSDDGGEESSDDGGEESSDDGAVSSEGSEVSSEDSGIVSLDTVTSNGITTPNHTPPQYEIGRSNSLGNIGSSSVAIPLFPSMLSAVSDEIGTTNDPVSSTVEPCDPADPACNPPCDLINWPLVTLSLALCLALSQCVRISQKCMIAMGIR
jgi:hypothetical protein